MEKYTKACKVAAPICLVISLFIALLPCFDIKSKVLKDIFQEYAGGYTDYDDWNEDNISNYLADAIATETIDNLGSGLVSNMARSSVVLLFVGMVYSYSSNMFLAMTYFILFLFGIPVLTLIAAGFQIWGKSKNKQITCCILLGINLLLALTIFITIPNFLVSVYKNLEIAGAVASVNAILVPVIRTITFQIMIRSMGIGFWGFIILQVLALACVVYRLLNENSISIEHVKAKSALGKLIGVTGAYAGAEVVLEADGVILGRDATEAQLIVDSPKISRRHCRIVYDQQKNQYYVTDYSTNGTFVNNRRLAKGVVEVLPAGTVVSLGDTKNSFRLQ